MFEKVGENLKIKNTETQSVESLLIQLEKNYKMIMQRMSKLEEYCEITNMRLQQMYYEMTKLTKMK